MSIALLKEQFGKRAAQDGPFHLGSLCSKDLHHLRFGLYANVSILAPVVQRLYDQPFDLGLLLV